MLRIPLEPATIPVNSGELLKSFHPAPAWIRLRQIQVILGVCLALLGIAAASLGMYLFGGSTKWQGGGTFWIWSSLETFGFIFVLISGVIRLVFLRLQYDCTWYVLTTRAMRIRRGLWVIHETTITYDNIQNVTVKQGPIQRLFKLSDIEVETAGGGGVADSGKKGSDSSHSGRIEGVVDPERLRELIMTQVRLSRSSGLGDGHEVSRDASAPSGHASPDWGRMSAVLKEIRDELRPADLQG
jgi:membrane protein YdbS with pleckstrin-like domain